MVNCLRKVPYWVRKYGNLTQESGVMRKLALRSPKGVTQIGLVALMAIVAVLSGFIPVAMPGPGLTSRDTQTKQDATIAETALANYFGNQLETRTCQSLVVEALEQRNIEEVQSGKWPQKYITEVYPQIFRRASLPE